MKISQNREPSLFHCNESTVVCYGNIFSVTFSTFLEPGLATVDQQLDNVLGCFIDFHSLIPLFDWFFACEIFGLYFDFWFSRLLYYWTSEILHRTCSHIIYCYLTGVERFQVVKALLQVWSFCLFYPIETIDIADLLVARQIQSWSPIELHQIRATHQEAPILHKLFLSWVRLCKASSCILISSRFIRRCRLSLRIFSILYCLPILSMLEVYIIGNSTGHIPQKELTTCIFLILNPKDCIVNWFIIFVIFILICHHWSLSFMVEADVCGLRGIIGPQFLWLICFPLIK